MALSINFGTYRSAQLWWFYFFSRNKKTTAVFRFPRKKTLASRTLPVEMVWARNWVGEFFFHETQVRWRPSEALRPVHDVVWKLNKLATKTSNTLLITFVGACDWYGTYRLYVHIYIYWSIFCWQNPSWEYFFAAAAYPLCFDIPSEEGMTFHQPTAYLKYVASKAV